MTEHPIPSPRRLQRTGLVVLGVGLVGAVLLAVLHGGLTWSNVGVPFTLAGIVMLVVGRVLESRARRDQRS